VTKKLEDQSLEEGEIVSQKECQLDDSGTESDDETEKDDVDDVESEDGDINLDSGVSLNLRSGAHQSGSSSKSRTKQLPSMTRQPPPPTVQESLPQMTGALLDDTDNHSSEEELEDIIGNSAKKKVYSGTAVSQAGSGRASIRGAGCSSTNPEKRKWSEVNSSGDDERSTSQCVFRAGSGSSGDEEVSGLMDGSTSSYTPVQFCTSPPLDVYKPRKSQSPPPKLFHMSGSNGQSGTGPSRQHSFDSSRSREGQRPSGAFLPRPRPRLLRPVEYSSLPSRGQVESGEYGLEDAEDVAVEDTGHYSPNKRHRSTPKPQNIQRPCLDFEKMQQIKTKVVTSWRQGTELSLFCW